MERREQIEEAANRLRGDWLVTLRELDRRRVETLSLEGLRSAVERHLGAVVLAGLGTAALVGGGVVWVWARKRKQRRRTNRVRLHAITRAWKHPERVATRAPDQPGGQLVARKVLMASLTTLGVQLGRRWVKGALKA